MKNRKREICTSGSVRDEAGQPPHLLGRRRFLHLAVGAAALPAVSRVARAQSCPTRPVRIIVGFPPSTTGPILEGSHSTSCSGLGKAGTFYYWISRGVDERPVRADRARKSVGAEN